MVTFRKILVISVEENWYITAKQEKNRAANVAKILSKTNFNDIYQNKYQK